MPEAGAKPLLIAPSILTADFGALSAEIQAAEAAGVDWIHLDVMDGVFVPNISFGPSTVAAVRAATRLPLDVHLMIEQPERHLKAFADAGADYLTIHTEATRHPHRAVQHIRELGVKAGAVINPGTPLSALEPLLPDLDLALLMTVNPGFGGQAYLRGSTERIAALRTLRDHLKPACLIEVDGGVKASNIREVALAGADVIVAGSALFNKNPISDNLKLLREAI